MHQEASDLERRFTDLQSQIDRLSGAEARSQHDVVSQFQELQRTIEHEWRSLRLIHEEPVRQLREQAANLTEVSIAAASSAVGGFDRTEARLAGLETSLHDRLTELSEQMRSAVAELRALGGGHQATLAPATPAWPLDDVVRLHNELRGANGAERQPAESAVQVRVPLGLPEAPSDISERMQTLERSLADGQTELNLVVARTSRTGRVSWVAVALVVVGIGSVSIVIGRIQRDAVAAAARAVDAERQARDQVVAARAEAARQVDEARAVAERAQTIANVLASPDLARFNLVGSQGALGFTAQALWSRSRGFVFSGSRLPPPPPGSTYQIWLYSGSDAISAGVFVPDSDGRFTVATDTPPRVPPPIGGVVVTIEGVGGAQRPTGPRLLGRAE